MINRTLLSPITITYCFFFFSAECECSYFSAHFKLKIFLWIFFDYSVWHFCFRMYWRLDAWKSSNFEAIAWRADDLEQKKAASRQNSDVTKPSPWKGSLSKTEHSSSSTNLLLSGFGSGYWTLKKRPKVSTPQHRSTHATEQLSASNYLQACPRWIEISGCEFRCWKPMQLDSKCSPGKANSNIVNNNHNKLP